VTYLSTFQLPSSRDSASRLITSVYCALLFPSPLRSGISVVLSSRSFRVQFMLFFFTVVLPVFMEFIEFIKVYLLSRRVLGTPCSESISVVSLHTLGLVDTWWQPHTWTNEECWIYPLGPNVRSFL